MKTTKLLVGILQMAMAALILFQSCSANFLTNFESRRTDTSGSAGLFVAALFLVAGLIYVNTRSRQTLGGDIAGLVLMLIAWLFAITNYGVYQDLQIWGWIGLIIGITFFIWHLIISKKIIKLGKLKNLSK